MVPSYVDTSGGCGKTLRQIGKIRKMQNVKSSFAGSEDGISALPPVVARAAIENGGDCLAGKNGPAHAERKYPEIVLMDETLEHLVRNKIEEMLYELRAIEVWDRSCAHDSQHGFIQAFAWVARRRRLLEILREFNQLFVEFVCH